MPGFPVTGFGYSNRARSFVRVMIALPAFAFQHIKGPFTVNRN